MKVKLETKERFHVISVLESALSANMTETLNEMLLLYLKEPIKNIILSLEEVHEIDNSIAEIIVNIQQAFYEKNCSFVICNLQKPIEKFLENIELLKLMNITPTESEAWDIIQMEEIEREMLNTPNP